MVVTQLKSAISSVLPSWIRTEDEAHVITDPEGIDGGELFSAGFR
jgi:hypothetical protein